MKNKNEELCEEELNSLRSDEFREFYKLGLILGYTDRELIEKWFDGCRYEDI